MDGQTVTNWSESKRFVTDILKIEPEIERPELSDHNRSSESLFTNGRNRNISQNSRSFGSFFDESEIKSMLSKGCADQCQPMRSVTEISRPKDEPEIRCSSLRNQMKPSPEKERRERTYGNVLKYQKCEGMAEESLRCNKNISKFSTYEGNPNFDNALMKPQNIEQRNPIKSDENTSEGKKNEGYIGKCEGIDAVCCTCSLRQVEVMKVTNADEAIMIKTVKPKEGDAVNQEDKGKPAMKRVCRVVSLKDTEFLHRIKQIPNIYDEMLKTNESSVSTETKNSEFVREAKTYSNEEKKVQIESTLATPNELPLTPHLNNRKPLLNENVRNVTQTLENRVKVEIKIRVQPNTSTPSVETERNRGTEDDRHETAKETSAIGWIVDSIEAKKRLCDQNSPTNKEIQAANTYEIKWNKIATIPIERQTSFEVSKDDGDSKQLSPNVDLQSKQDAVVTNRDNFLGKIPHDDDDNETDDSPHARESLVLSQLTDKTSLPGLNVDEISTAANAGDDTIRNSLADSRAVIEDVEQMKLEFQSDVNRKPTELRTRRRAVTIAGIKPELSEIIQNYYQTPEIFLRVESKKNDVTKSEDLGSVSDLRKNHTNAVTEPRDQMSRGRSISLHQPIAYGLQPRLWKLPSFRSYSNNKMIFTNDRGLLQQLSDEVKDILMTDARRRRLSSNEIQKTTEKTDDDQQQQQQTDANYEVQTEVKLSLENQFNSTFNDATEFQGVQSEISKPEETTHLDETLPPKFHYNGATDVDFPTSESIIIEDCGSNLSTSEHASNKPKPSDVAFQDTGKITEPKPCENHAREKDERNLLDALSDDMLAKALERMVVIAASEEYLKLVDLTEREERESVLRRQRKDGRKFQPRRSLHEKSLSANEKLQNPLAESSDKS